MGRTAREPVSAQPLPGGEGAGTITIEVAAKLLMVTSEWVRRLTKDGWIAKPPPTDPRRAFSVRLRARKNAGSSSRIWSRAANGPTRPDGTFGNHKGNTYSS